MVVEGQHQLQGRSPKATGLRPLRTPVAADIGPRYVNVVVIKPVSAPGMLTFLANAFGSHAPVLQMLWVREASPSMSSDCKV